MTVSRTIRAKVREFLATASQREAARVSGVNQSTICQINLGTHCGRFRPATMRGLRRLGVDKADFG